MFPIFIDGARNPFAYNGLSFNVEESIDSTFMLEDAGVDESWDAVVEPYPDRDGVQAGEPRSIQKILSFRGWVKATTNAGLLDKVRSLNKAFNPVLAYLNDSATTIDRGYLALSFNIPTADTTNYPSGLIPVQYYAQATKLPVAVSSKFQGTQAHMAITLRTADPRLYAQSTTSANRTGNGTISVANVLAQYPSYPVIRCAFTTAPSGSPTLTYDSKVITLVGANLAGSKTLDIDLKARTAQYTDLTNKISAIAGTSVFFKILPTTQNLTVAGFPSDAVITVTWRRAYI